MNGYNLSRAIFDYSFENSGKIKPNHIAVYFFAIEHCNRLGWKKQFGFPSSMVMEAVGISSYNTYSKVISELVEYGFIDMIQKSKNQYQSNIIALSNFDKALDKALDKAIIKHDTKQEESTIRSTDSINKPQTNKPLNNKQQTKDISLKKINFENWKSELIEKGARLEDVDDWIKIRISKKAEFTERALNSFLNECQKNNFSIKEAVKICADNGWKGFKFCWVSKDFGFKKSKEILQTADQGEFNLYE